MVTGMRARHYYDIINNFNVHVKEKIKIERAKIYDVNMSYVCDILFMFYVIRTMHFEIVNISSVPSQT